MGNSSLRECQNNNLTPDVISENANNTDENMDLSEYNALRAEKLNRYDYSNKLFTDTITFTSAILAAVIGLYAINFSGIDSIVFKFIQVFLLLLPVLFVRMTFIYSLQNAIRINLISEYIRCKYPKISWENMKKEKNLFYFDKHDNKKIEYIIKENNTELKQPIQSQKVGDMLPTCLGISIVSLAVAVVMLCLLIQNCIFTACSSSDYFNLVENNRLPNQIVLTNSSILFVGIILCVTIKIVKYICFIHKGKAIRELNGKRINSHYIDEGNKKFWIIMQVILCLVVLIASVVVNCAMKELHDSICNTYSFTIMFFICLFPTIICAVICLTQNYFYEVRKANIIISENANLVSNYFNS